MPASPQTTPSSAPSSASIVIATSQSFAASAGDSAIRAPASSASALARDRL